MATSRLIVKNLPDSATDIKIRELFSTRGIVTDVQLKYTPDGRFRYFAFVGYKTPEEADTAREYVHNTYFGAAKIQVEPCAKLGDISKPRAWSKYAAEKEKPNKIKKIIEQEDDDEEPKKKKKKKKEEEILEKCKEDPKFVEFLEAHIQKSTWGNDTVIQDLESQLLGKAKKKEKSEVIESTSEFQDTVEDDTPQKESSDAEENKKKKKNKGKTLEEKLVAKKLPDKEFFTLKLRNLPQKAKKKDLKLFFKPLKLKSIRFPPKFRGIAYIGFETDEDRRKALYKNKGFIHGNQVHIRKSESTKRVEEQIEGKKNRWIEQQAALERETETVGESGRIFLRNLCYQTTEDDIRNLFEQVGPVTEVHLPIDKITRQLKGFGFVSFLLPEHAATAFTELDGSVLHGRMLHLLPSKSKEEMTADDMLAGSSYKNKKELERKKSAGMTHNWNTLFLCSNVVAEVIANKYKVSKEQLLLDNADEQGKDSGTAAVRMALAETEIVTETKKFLENNGVHLGAFEENTIKTKRSTTCLLVKNLPPTTSAEELNDLFSKHGVISRIILPPTGVIAIVEFVEPAYSKFKNVPLYLEWAPVDVFGVKKEDDVQSKEYSANDTSAKEKKTTIKDEIKEPMKQKDLTGFDYDSIPEPDTTLFVKNLNFSTAEDVFKKHFEECGPVYSVSIAKKRDPKQPGNLLSMGYCFVQFYRAQDAADSLKYHQNSLLENHFLELKKSNRTLQTENSRKDSSQSNEKSGTKILVRNIPFQAQKEEIAQLFRTFGELKAIRLPMKSDGSGEHRGFVFIEFHTKPEAKKAFDILSKSTHLYGRRLVLEWASQEYTVEDLRQKTAKKFDLQT